MTIRAAAAVQPQPAQAIIAKRRYSAPRLIVHGTVAALTQAKWGGQLLGAIYLAAGQMGLNETRG